MDTSSSTVIPALTGKRILLTGTTGFVGKAVLEKLLRAIPDVGRIVLLVRGNRKYPDARERFVNEIASSSIFDTLREQLGDGFDAFLADKVEVVAGELTAPALGLDAVAFDRLGQSLDVIINCAASVNFREELDQALAINTLCLRSLLDLAERGTRTAFVQISTCYVHGYHQGRIEEVNHPPAKGGIPLHADGYYDVEPVIEQFQADIGKVLARHPGDEARSRALIDLGIRHAHRYGWNDTYTLTKWMGEQLLFKYRQGKSLTIVRPAIVESTWQEPVPGWVEGVKVADAVILAYAREKVFLFPGRRRGVIDVIPVDLVANSIVLAAAETQVEHSTEHRIYQCCSGDTNPITLGEFIDHLQEEAEAHYDKYDKLFYRRPRQKFHTIPRWLFSLLMRSGYALMKGASVVKAKLGGEVNSRAMDVIRTTLHLALVFAFYTVPRYRFSNLKLRDLSARMGETDTRLFPVDAAVFDWRTYLRDIHMAGLNRYALKPRKAAKPSPKALRKAERKAARKREHEVV